MKLIFKTNGLNLYSCTYDPILSIHNKNSYELICLNFEKLLINFRKYSLNKIVFPKHLISLVTDDIDLVVDKIDELN